MSGPGEKAMLEVARPDPTPEPDRRRRTTTPGGFDAALHGGEDVPGGPAHPGHERGRRGVRERGLPQCRERRDVGAFLRERRPAQDVLRLRRPEPGSDPRRGREEPAAGGPRHPGLGAGPLLLPGLRWRPPGGDGPPGGVPGSEARVIGFGRAGAQNAIWSWTKPLSWMNATS